MFIRYEEMLLNALPAPFSMLYKGCILNFSGLTLANQAVHPLYGRNFDSEKTIFGCESLSAQFVPKSRFRIVFQRDYQEFDDTLFKNGYERESQGVVKKIGIATLQKELFTFANFIGNGIYIDEEVKEYWKADYFYLRALEPEQISALEPSLQKSLCDMAFFTFIQEETLLGQGYASFQGKTMIVQDIVVDPKYRQLSYGRRILMSMLSYAYRKGCQYALVDVPFEDTVASKLFSKVGFEDLYGYCYRSKKLS